MSTLYYESSLSHHGVRGQKWGVRRFQNPDGSLTSKGQKHYAREAEKLKKYNDKQEAKGKKLHESGTTVEDITTKNRLVKESINLGSSLTRIILFATGIGMTPIGAASMATITAGTIAYNIISNKIMQTNISALNTYTSNIKRGRK